MFRDPKDSETKAREHAERNGMRFPVLLDRDGRVSASYAPPGAIPDLPRDQVMIGSVLLLDRAGRVRFMKLIDSRHFDPRLQALRHSLDQLLAQP